MKRSSEQIIRTVFSPPRSASNRREGNTLEKSPMPSRTWSALVLRHKLLRSTRMPMPRRFRPGIEHLEDRTTPATLFVTNTDDSGDGSLRDRIADAVSGDTIAFQ